MQGVKGLKDRVGLRLYDEVIISCDLWFQHVMGGTLASAQMLLMIFED